jgi:hypothetical protein
MNKNTISLTKLLDMHIEALFTLDPQKRLLTINEPWDKKKLAPKLYLGKTADGSIAYRFRFDVQLEIIEKLEKLLSKESSQCLENQMMYVNEYMEILESKNCFNEICFFCEDSLNATEKTCVKLTPQNIARYKVNNFEWLNEEIAYCQPCFGVMENDELLSLCRSVRISDKAHEAGIETAENHRGKGFAGIALRNWAKEVLEKGCIAFYSAAADNFKSQRTAEKAQLYRYGIGLSIY